METLIPTNDLIADLDRLIAVKSANAHLNDDDVWEAMQSFQADVLGRVEALPVDRRNATIRAKGIVAIHIGDDDITDACTDERLAMLMKQDFCSPALPERCNRCRFWREDMAARDGDDPDWGFGRCRRAPPVVSETYVAVLMPKLEYGQQADPDIDTVATTTASLFPATFATDWCGHFEGDRI